MRRLALLIALAAGPAFAHEAGGAEPASWFDDPLVEALLLVAIALYALGFAAMRARRPRKAPVGGTRTAAFAAAILVLIAALLSPIDALAETSFAVHMAQHLLLIVVVAPLLAYSDAHLVLLRAFPRTARRRIGRTVASIPGVRQAGQRKVAAWIAAGLFVATMWIWHVPAAYDWALRNPAMHVVEHLTLLATATFFWRVILTSGNRRLDPATAVILVSLVGLQGSFLAALIMFAGHPLYGAYAGNPLDDQVLAGLLMCIPASFVYLGSTVWALSRMLRNGSPDARPDAR